MSKDSWVINETKLSDFGDTRLNTRFTKVLRNLSSTPELSVSSSCKGWKETLAAYRFMSNDKVNDETIIAPHRQETLSRISKEETVLVLQDTTEVDFTTHSTISDMGRLTTDHSKGFYFHPSIAVTPDKRCLGVVDICAWNRPAIASGDKKKNYHKKPIEEKESYCWLKGYDAANEVALAFPDTKIINVADREGDIFELLKKQPSEDNKAYWLIRSMHNRKTANDNDNEVNLRLREKVQSSDAIGVIEFSLSDAVSYRNSSFKYRNKRTARIVKQEVRACKVEIEPPRYLRKSTDNIIINAVYCSEIDTPDGEKPVEWLLLTTYPVDDVQTAYQIINWYLCRWQIEIFFKILKSGCKVEKMQFGTYRATLNCLAIYSIVAWRILYITMMGRQNPEVSCEAVFEHSEWQAAYLIGKKKPPPATPPSLNEIIKLITEFGGYLGRKNDKPPGPSIMWLGMQRLRDFTIAWETFNLINKESCV